MSLIIRTAIESLSVADALQGVIVQAARLQKAGVLEMHEAPECATLISTGPIVVDALTTMAARLATLETVRTPA